MRELSNIGSRSPVWVTWNRDRHTLTVQVRRLFIVGLHLPAVAFFRGLV